MTQPPLNLADCPAGIAYRIRTVAGGQALQLRLQHMGLAPGKPVIKRSDQLFRGPVVVRVQSTELAIGHRTAQRILLEPVDETPGPGRQS
jgi:Fe2+ transport system protein FeoA